MKEILDALVEGLREQALALQAVAEQVATLKETIGRRDQELADELKKQVEAVAMQTVADRVTTLQQMLATHNDGLAGALKTQAEADREKSRAAVYALQVNVANLREAVTHAVTAAPARREPRPGVKKAKKTERRKPHSSR